MTRRVVGLVGCVKSKTPGVTPARDLYVSPLFKARRRYVEASCDAWWVLSALHGLLAPDQDVAPYDLTLATMSAEERYQWSVMVLAAIDRHAGLEVGDVVEVHAGALYRDSGLVDGLLARGLRVEVPTRGLGIGEQLRFYKGS